VLKSTRLLLRQIYSHLQLPRSPTPRQQPAPISIIRKMSRILPTLTPVWHNFHQPQLSLHPPIATLFMYIASRPT
jgi:hypothetical protein